MRSMLVRLLLLAAIGLTAAAADTNLFPLMAWNGGVSDLNTFKKMRECGLTVAGFVSPKELNLCEAAGLKAIVSDPRASNYDWQHLDEAAARRNIESLIAETAKHPAVYGYYLRDEPNSSLFPGLGKVSDFIRELAPGKWPYINLFPNYASPQQLGNASYTEHLEQFVATCHPAALSYDHYALMDDGSLRHGYWQNLESMRAAAKKHHLPFWNIVLSVAHFNYREPNAADMRFQVYSTLAYGGRGLAYFTYFAPQIGNYRMAPIDQFGNETVTWRYMQNVNLQVAKLAPTLLQLQSDAVYHLGEVPDGCQGPGEKSLLTGPKGPFTAGDFTHADGSRYVMVVNTDLAKSHHLAPQFREATKGVRMVSPYTGQLTGFGGEQVWLAPGQGVLLKRD